MQERVQVIVVNPHHRTHGRPSLVGSDTRKLSRAMLYLRPSFLIRCWSAKVPRGPAPRNVVLNAQKAHLLAGLPQIEPQVEIRRVTRGL